LILRFSWDALAPSQWGRSGRQHPNTATAGRRRRCGADAYPVSPEPSLRAQRGNLVGVTAFLSATRSPCRCAPRD